MFTCYQFLFCWNSVHETNLCSIYYHGNIQFVTGFGYYYPILLKQVIPKGNTIFANLVWVQNCVIQFISKVYHLILDQDISFLIPGAVIKSTVGPGLNSVISRLAVEPLESKYFDHAVHRM